MQGGNSFECQTCHRHAGMWREIDRFVVVAQAHATCVADDDAEGRQASHVLLTARLVQFREYHLVVSIPHFDPRFLIELQMKLPFSRRSTSDNRRVRQGVVLPRMMPEY